MRQSRKTRSAISLLIAGISVLVWILLLFNPGNILSIQHCHVSDAGPSATSLQMLLAMNPFSSLMLGWGLMVVAMMLPKLTSPIQLIYARSFKRYRLLSILLFVSGYTAVWMAVGVLMIAMILGFHLLMPHSFMPAIGVGIVALIWQFSPIKQRFLNLGHNHRSLASFGWAAYLDAFKYGAEHGIWCVGSGWALMLFPMLLPQGHNLGMLVVTFIMLSEHLEHPVRPRWNTNLRLKLLRIIMVQAKIRAKQVLPT